jgi:hypothetical protein
LTGGCTSTWPPDLRRRGGFDRSEGLFRLLQTAGGYERLWQCRQEFEKLLREISGLEDKPRSLGVDS